MRKGHNRLKIALLIIMVMSVWCGCLNERTDLDNKAVISTELKVEYAKQPENSNLDITGISNIFADFYWMGNDNVAYFNEDNQLMIYSLKSGTVIKTLECSNDNAYSQKVSYAEDGIIVYGISEKQALTGTAYADIYYSDLTSRHIDFKDYLKDAWYEYQPIRLSRNRKQIAYISKDNILKIYDFDSKKSEDICELGKLYIVNMEFSWDGKSIMFSGKIMPDNGNEQDGFGFIKIEQKKINFYEDKYADNRLQVTQNGVFLDAKAAFFGEKGERCLYRITDEGYEKIRVENSDETQKVNVSLSGKFFATQSENLVKVYKIGEAKPISVFKNEDYNEENSSGNALIIEEDRLVLCSFAEDKRNRTYSFKY